MSSKNIRITAADGKTYNTQHYKQEFTIKAYTMDDERLKNDGSILGKKYFEQQLFKPKGAAA
jgi:hypothetical protein